MLRLATLAAFVLAGTAATAAEFPAGKSVVIQIGRAQSGLAEYLVPPLNEALREAGLVYRGGPDAEFVATVERRSDVGKWVGKGDQKRWLYTLSMTVGLSPASMDVEPGGTLAPAYSVTAEMLTENEDRPAEWACLTKTAMRALKQSYRARGKRKVDGSACGR